MSKQTTADFTAVVAESQKQALAAIMRAHESMLTLARFGLGTMPATGASAWSLPRATDVVQAGYDFAGKVLDEQKAFALRLTEIASSQVEDVKKTVA